MNLGTDCESILCTYMKITDLQTKVRMLKISIGEKFILLIT